MEMGWGNFSWLLISVLLIVGSHLSSSFTATVEPVRRLMHTPLGSEGRQRVCALGEGPTRPQGEPLTCALLGNLSVRDLRRHVQVAERSVRSIDAATNNAPSGAWNARKGASPGRCCLRHERSVGESDRR